MVSKKLINILWYGLFILVSLTGVAYVVYSYLMGAKGVTKYIPTYKFFHSPSWKTFKGWLASMMNDPAGDVILIGIVLMIPFPFLPQEPHNRVELLLSKLGLYYLVGFAVLGKPNFVTNSKDTKEEYIMGWVIIYILLAIIFGSTLFYSEFMNVIF